MKLSIKSSPVGLEELHLSFDALSSPGSSQGHEILLALPCKAGILCLRIIIEYSSFKGFYQC